MHLFNFCSIFPLRGAKEKKNRKKERSTIGLWSRASKATGHTITRSFLPKKLVCPQLLPHPFPLGLKVLLSVKNISPGSDSTFLLSAIYFSVWLNQWQFLSWEPPWGTVADGWKGEATGILCHPDSSHSRQCCRLGTVVSVVLSYMQRARGSSMYPYHLQFLILATLYMYVWVE